MIVECIKPFSMDKSAQGSILPWVPVLGEMYAVIKEHLYEGEVYYQFRENDEQAYHASFFAPVEILINEITEYLELPLEHEHA